MAKQGLGGRNFDSRTVFTMAQLIVFSVFKKLVNDTYANYVMQKVYDYASIEVKQEFVALILGLNQRSMLNSHGNNPRFYLKKKQLLGYIVLKYLENNHSNNNSKGKTLPTYPVYESNEPMAVY